MDMHQVTQLLDQTETAPAVVLAGTHGVAFLVRAAAAAPRILPHFLSAAWQIGFLVLRAGISSGRLAESALLYNSLTTDV